MRAWLYPHDFDVESRDNLLFQIADFQMTGKSLITKEDVRVPKWKGAQVCEKGSGKSWLINSAQISIEVAPLLFKKTSP